MHQKFELELTAGYSKYESALASLHIADYYPTRPPETPEHCRILAALSQKQKQTLWFGILVPGSVAQRTAESLKIAPRG